MASKGGRVRATARSTGFNRGGPTRPKSTGPATREDAVLDLQRTAGNQAVVQRLGGGLLRQGSKGPEVKKLQEALNDRGANLDPDSIFGGQTKAAVVSFQRANGLGPDGIVGPKTWGALGGGGGGGGNAVAADPLIAVKLAEVKVLLAKVKASKAPGPQAETLQANSDVAMQPWGRDEDSEEEGSWWDQATEAASDAYDAVTGAAGEAAEAVSETVAGAVDTVVETATDVYNAAAETATDVYNAAAETASGVATAVGETVSGVVQGVSGVVSTVTDAVSETANEVLDDVKAIGNDVKEFLGEAWTKLEQVLGDLGKLITSPFALPAIDDVIKKLKELIGGGDEESDEDSGTIDDISRTTPGLADKGKGNFTFEKGATSHDPGLAVTQGFGYAEPKFTLTNSSWKRSKGTVTISGTATCTPTWNMRAPNNQKDVNSADDPAVTADTWEDIVKDLRTDSRGEPTRKDYWSSAATSFHEQIHCADYLRFADTEFSYLSMSLENTGVNVRPAGKDKWHHHLQNEIAAYMAASIAVDNWSAAVKRDYQQKGELPVYESTAPKYNGIVDAIEKRAAKEKWPKKKKTGT